MAHVVADRVRETTTTTGTGTYTLAGAVTGFETFGSVGNSNTTYYCCTDGTDFEVGVGTYTSSGTTLARTTILQSSNSDNAVNWSSGTRQIFCTAPAEKSVILDPNNDTTIKSSDGAILKLQTSDTTVVDGNVVGAIEFTAPDEASGTDAITTAASIVAEADATFGSNDNRTDLLFKTGYSSAASTTMRLGHGGDLTLFANNRGGVPMIFLAVGTESTNGQTNAIFSNSSGQLCFGMDGSTSNVVFFLDDEDGQPIFTFQEEDGTDIMDGGDTDVTVHKPFIVNDDITAKTSDGAILKLQTSDTTVADGDVIGAIEFSAPDEASGTDAVTTAASIVAEADDTFAADNNKTDLVIKLGKSEAAVERGRFKHEGGLDITGYDTDANPDPSLSLRRNTASPADGDFIGSIYFYGKNSADAYFTYGAILAVSNDVTNGTEDGKLIFRVGDAGNEAWSGASNNLITLTPDTIAFDASSGTTFGGHDISSVGEISATSLDISGDVDVDGTLEADAMTLNGTAITTTATLSTGISNNNVPKFTSGVADNDFLRVDGTAIEGRSASEVLSDIGGTTASDAANEATALAIALG